MATKHLLYVVTSVVSVLIFLALIAETNFTRDFATLMATTATATSDETKETTASSSSTTSLRKTVSEITKTAAPETATPSFSPTTKATVMASSLSPTTTTTTLPKQTVAQQFYQDRNVGEPRDFTTNNKAVIVTKIHGDAFVPLLFKSFCLLKYAYNQRTQHDIVVFHSLPLDTTRQQDFVRLMAPANVRFVLDEMTLQDQLHNMTNTQQVNLLQRCIDGVTINTTTDPSTLATHLDWQNRCIEQGIRYTVAYGWMAEFRSRLLWNHTALQRYKYMMWMDTDALSLSPWQQDPVAFVARNNAVLLQGNVGGTAKADWGVHERIMEAYQNQTLCWSLSNAARGGLLDVKYGTGRCSGGVKQTHGFFHVLDLDFYRLPQNLAWSNTMMAGQRFGRLFDDQLAVKVPAAMLAPNRTYLSTMAGLELPIMHHGNIMEGYLYKGRFPVYWRDKANETFPEGYEKCAAYARA